MPLPTPEFVPDLDIERRALGVLKEYERITTRPTTLPVRVDDLVERVLDLEIIWLDIPENPGDIVLARIVPNLEGRPVVQMNEGRREHFEEYFGTEAFSLGHEAGHWVLQYDRGRSEQLGFAELLGEDVTPILCRRLDDRSRREFQAEKFAAYLLMPERLIREAVRGEDLTRWNTISHLAYACGVSKRALIRRLVELRLVVLTQDNRLELPTALRGASRLL